MRSVKETLIQMNQDHVTAVRSELAADEGYNQFTLVILDAYLNGNSETDVQESLNLDLKSFKLFERNIQKSILDFYHIEDKKVQDLIFSSIFYSLYSSKHENANAKNQELEQLFHSMKQFEIEQASTPVLKSLYEAHKQTPLEAVYEHLYLKYSEMESLNELLLNEFKNLNTLLGQFLEGSENEKKLILQYKKIRKLSLGAENNTAKMIFQLSKLICIIFANQSQLLKDSNMGLGELLTSTNHGVNKLPFGIDRFYLKNIYQHVYARHLENVDKKEIARFLLQKEKEMHLFEASNFNFPNHISKKYTYKSSPINISENAADKTENFLYIANKNMANQNREKINFLGGNLFSNILN